LFTLFGSMTEDSDSGDPDVFAHVQQALDEDLTRALMAAPTLLRSTSDDGCAIDELSPDEAADVMQEVFEIVLRHSSNIAGAAAAAYTRVEQLEHRVEKLERQVQAEQA
jgi:hypothetical protein